MVGIDKNTKHMKKDKLLILPVGSALNNISHIISLIS